MAVVTSVKELWVLDPTTNPEPIETTMAVTLDTLDGKVMGILDNAKPNSDKVLEMVCELLEKRYKLAGVVKRRKPNASKGAPQDMLDEIARECHFVITGVGD